MEVVILSEAKDLLLARRGNSPRENHCGEFVMPVLPVEPEEPLDPPRLFN
jgi:hypothetical protein